MEADVEIGIVKADCEGAEGEEIYWIFSRKQLEYVVKELESTESGATNKASYMNMELPVVSLENHFGFSRKRTDSKGLRYLVLCSADEKGTVHRLLVEVIGSPRFLKLANSFEPQENFTVAANEDHFHGAYTMGDRKIVVVPDVISISEAFG